MPLRNSDRAYYKSGIAEHIGMPELGQFHSREHYYSVFAHEITHSTGNKNRLDRDMQSNAQLDRFTTTLKDMLHNGPKGFRKEYMKLLVSRVDVGKQNITVTGPKAALAVALKAGNTSKERVPSFVRDWCT